MMYLYERTAGGGRGGQIGGEEPNEETQSAQRRPRRREEIRRRGHELVLKNWAGFGDVGVKRFDDGGVLLLDNAALELEGEGEAAIVESKILGEKSEAFDGFVLREMDGETLDLGVD
jgi:hypothetical protein